MMNYLIYILGLKATRELENIMLNTQSVGHLKGQSGRYKGYKGYIQVEPGEVAADFFLGSTNFLFLKKSSVWETLGLKWMNYYYQTKSNQENLMLNTQSVGHLKGQSGHDKGHKGRAGGGRT